MVTTVGWQTDVIDALKSLLVLEYDAVDAYEAALNRLENPDYKEALQTFKKDHERHIEDLSTFLREQSEIFPTGPGPKSLLTQGKVVLANLVGDKMILRAMRSNEKDTNTAYERINTYEDTPVTIKGTLRRNREDERRHLAWLEDVLGAEEEE